MDGTQTIEIEIDEKDFIFYTLGYSLLILPILTLLYFIKNKLVIKILSLFLTIYTAISWFLINSALFEDRVSGWSTYTKEEELYSVALDSKYILPFCLLVFSYILYYLLIRKSNQKLIK